MAGKVVFAEVFRKLRKEKNVTQGALADSVGLKKSVIGGYENGTGYPSFDGLVKIADFFGVSLDYLVYGIQTEITLEVNTNNEPENTYLSKDEMLGKLINEMEFKTKQLQKCEEEVERLKNGGTIVYGQKLGSTKEP